MKEAQAKKQLSRMLQSFTVGAVLHLLSELFKESAVRAKDAGDEHAHERVDEPSLRELLRRLFEINQMEQGRLATM